MPKPRLAVIVLAAGKGSRMQSELPKVFHHLAGQPMLRHVLATAETLAPERIVVVVGPDMPTIASIAHPHAVAIQAEPRGTGDAVIAALPALGEDAADDILVLYGDTPLITAATLRRLVNERQRRRAAIVVLGFQAPSLTTYGRLVLDADGGLVRIVEAADASDAELAIDLCNSGVMAVDGKSLAALTRQLAPSSASGEYYLTDLVALARDAGRAAGVVEAAADELIGVNSRSEQAAAEQILQGRLRAAAMEGGATLVDPATVWLCADTVIGRDVVIGPCVTFGPAVTIEDGVEIKPHCHIEGAVIRRGAIVGPFARLRPGTDIDERAHVGNFVELKNTHLGPGAKANHLSYLGDADIGAGTNIGAGSITCNYDGFFKYRTTIGKGVFIGSDAALVAPVTIGDGAFVAAGSVITNDVPSDALAIARGRQVELPGRAAEFRELKQREKSQLVSVKKTK